MTDPRWPKPSIPQGMRPPVPANPHVEEDELKAAGVEHPTKPEHPDKPGKPQPFSPPQGPPPPPPPPPPTSE